MAATTVINAVAVNPLATSANNDFALTAPATGVDLTLSNVAAGAIAGAVLFAQISLDGTTFAEPTKLVEVLPGETRQVYHDAKNAAKVRYTVHNRDSSVTATVTLIAIQV